MGGGIGGWWYNLDGSVWRDAHGDDFVTYLWSDDGKRKLNLNHVGNDWNDSYRFLAVRK